MSQQAKHPVPITPELMKKLVGIVSERRSQARHPALLPVHVTALGQDGKHASFTAGTLDLSYSGVRVHTTRKLSVGSRVTMTIKFPEHRIEVDAQCKVIWHSDTVAGHEAGLKILWKVPKGKKENTTAD